MLPAVNDKVVRDELAVVVTAGWDLPQREQRALEVRHLLEIARRSESEDYSTLAARFLTMLERAIDDESGDEFEEPLPLFTTEQAYGLKILFGVLPPYRLAETKVRREEAAPYLRIGSRVIDTASWARRQQDHWLQQVVECLRRVYGQDVNRSDYESLRKTSFAHVGEDLLIRSVRVENHVRSLVDGFREIKYNFYTDPETHLSEILLEALHGVELEMNKKPAGRYFLVVRLPEPLAVGEEAHWGFERTYEYGDAAVVPERDRSTLIVNRPFTEVQITVKFAGVIPTELWRLDGTSPRQLPSEPAPEEYGEPEHRKRLRTEANSNGLVEFPLTSKTQRYRAYGIAWKWRNS